MTIQFTDSHCHLGYDYDSKTIDQILQDSRAAGVTRWINVGVDMPNLDSVAQIATKDDQIFFSVGIHPHEAVDFRAENLETMRGFLKNPKCVAIGEIGLDTHYTHSSLEQKLYALRQQLEFAASVNKPVIIHSRNEESRLLEELKHFDRLSHLGKNKGVLHCFTGTEKFAMACIDLGFYVSFSGILTFKNAEDVRRVATTIPIERLLVETDSPYLAPIPYRGKKCEPAFLPHTAQVLAHLKNLPISDLAKATWDNTSRLFSL